MCVSEGREIGSRRGACVREGSVVPEGMAVVV